MADTPIPVADLPLATPGAYDYLVGVQLGTAVRFASSAFGGGSPGGGAGTVTSISAYPAGVGLSIAGPATITESGNWVFSLSESLQAWHAIDPSSKADTAALAAPTGCSLVGFQQAGTGATTRTVLTKARDLVSFMDFGATPSQADYPTEVTNTFAQALANLSAPVTLPGVGVVSPQDRLAYLCAKMAAGQAVKIACYGDSTTDGQGTTGWTANPTSGGNALGTGDHEPDAPNAWPAKLKTTLRAMFGNNNISVWNAGYTGQRLDSGWAYSNYAAAVLNNPAYGKPDICFVAFGLNDISVTGSQIANHAKETRKLCARLLLNGTVPVLLGCDAMYRGGGTDTRDHKEASRQIDEAKRSVATELGIPYIDVDLAMKQWMNRNEDGLQWSVEQPDGLHFGNKGHAFKAGLIARHLFRDTVVLTGSAKRQRVETWDSRCAYVGNYSTRYTLANNAQGGNILYSSGAPTSTVMMRVWVWNESPDTELIYRGLDNENFSAAGTANAPFVRVTSYIDGSVSSKTPAGVGFTYTSGFRRSDIPYRFGRLPYGLSCVEYVSGTGSALFYGYFEFVQSRTDGLRDALRGRRKLIQSTPSTGTIAYQNNAAEDGCNEAAIFADQTLELFLDAELPVGNGVVLYSLPNLGYSDSGYRAGVILYRRPTNGVRLYAYQRAADGTVTFLGIGLESAALTWAPDGRKAFRFTLARSGDNQVMNLYEGYASTTAIISTTLTTSVATIPFGGVFGGIYHNSSEAGGASVVTLHEMLYRIG